MTEKDVFRYSGKDSTGKLTSRVRTDIAQKSYKPAYGSLHSKRAAAVRFLNAPGGIGSILLSYDQGKTFHFGTVVGRGNGTMAVIDSWHRHGRKWGPIRFQVYKLVRGKARVSSTTRSAPGIPQRSYVRSTEFARSSKPWRPASWKYAPAP